MTIFSLYFIVYLLGVYVALHAIRFINPYISFHGDKFGLFSTIGSWFTAAIISLMAIVLFCSYLLELFETSAFKARIRKEIISLKVWCNIEPPSED